MELFCSVIISFVFMFTTNFMEKSIIETEGYVNL